jgi:two-component system, OmpR family, response regulator
MCSRPRILVVDDDAEIRELLSSSLRSFGMQVDKASCGEELRAAISSVRYSLIVLDLMLPDEDGLVLCRQIRQSSDVPVIMLTARGEATERIVGLEIGADDYVIKPFEPRELVARIRAIMRRVRRENASTNYIAFGDWRLDMSARHLIADDDTIVALSNAEFRLLSAFLAAPGRVLSRDHLMDASMGKAADAYDRGIDVLISRLRQKLRDDSKFPKLIRTVRGEGYVFASDTR